jgi:HlyD family secretion protein
MLRKSHLDSRNWRSSAITGYAIIISTFGVAGGWAAVTEIDKAVVAPAFVAVESNRKVVQHLEGGMVSEILIKDGQAVREGDVLFRLDDTQVGASLEVVRNQLDAALALEARLVAEREERDRIEWPNELKERHASPGVSRIIGDQMAQFTDRSNSIRGQVNILEERITQLRTSIEGMAREKASTEQQVAYIHEELAGLRELRAKELIPLTRLLTMERERTRLEGVIGRSIASIAQAESQIGEAGLQIVQLRQKFREETAAALLDVRQKIADYREKLTVAQDILRRVEIVAPRSGNVQGLKVFTVGQVIRPGEQLLEIVPKDEHLVIHAQFSPNDIDTIHVGQKAEIRFPAFHALKPPVMFGNLESLSRDRLTDEATRQPYYLGFISLREAEIPEELRSRLRAGMPAEVIVASGERTVLSYIVNPLSNHMRKSFTEQ